MMSEGVVLHHWTIGCVSVGGDERGPRNEGRRGGGYWNLTATVIRQKKKYLCSGIPTLLFCPDPKVSSDF